MRTPKEHSRKKSKNIEGFNVQVQIMLQNKQQQQREKNIIDATDVGIWCYISIFFKNRQSVGKTKGGPKRTAPDKPTAVILSQATLKVNDPKFTLAS